MIFKNKKHHRHLTNSQGYGRSDIAASDYSENLKPLTNAGTTDRMKKFSYIDKQGERNESTKKQVKKKDIRDMDLEIVGKYINIGYYLVIPILIGTIVGIYIDSKFGTQPKFTLSLILLGAALSIYNLFSLAKKENA